MRYIHQILFPFSLIAALVMSSAYAQTLVTTPPAPHFLSQGPILLQNIGVIDGLGNARVPHQDVLIDQGLIRDIAPHGKLPVPDDAMVIDGDGKTVMPGLIDGHSHLLVNPAKGDPEAYHVLEIWRPLPANLYAGVTTISDMGSSLNFASDLRDAVAQGDLAGPTVHTVGDYFEEGTERDRYMAPRRLDRMADYITLLDLHHEKDIKMIKAYVTMPLIRVSILAQEAQKRNIAVVVDNFAWIGSTDYIKAGVDGFAHVPYLFPISAEEISDAKKNGIWFVGTIAIANQVSAATNRVLRDGTDFLSDPMVAHFYHPEEIETMRSPEYSNELIDAFVASAKEAYGQQFLSNIDQAQEIGIANLKALLDAGILVGLGTDPLFPGMFHGEAVHYEMETWSLGGIPNVRIIQAATHDNARILGIDESVGSIQPGLQADLLIVEGDPAHRISDTRNIVSVIKDGKIVDRDALVFSPE